MTTSSMTSKYQSKDWREEKYRRDYGIVKNEHPPKEESPILASKSRQGVSKTMVDDKKITPSVSLDDKSFKSSGAPNASPFNVKTGVLMVAIFAMLMPIFGQCEAVPIRQCGDAACEDDLAPKEGVTLTEFTMPPGVKASIMWSLFTTPKLPTHEGANLQGINKFMAFSKALVETKLRDDEDGADLLKALDNLDFERTPLLIKNNPIDSFVPPTPTDGSRTIVKTTNVAELVSAGLVGVAGGTIVSYPWEVQYSDTCFHVGFALQANQTAGSALSSAKSSLPPHTDMSYMHPDFMPDLLLLYGLREGNDERVETIIIDNNVVLSFVPVELQHVLREHRFIFEKPKWVKAEGLKGLSSIGSGASFIVSGYSRPLIRLPAGGGKELLRPADEKDEVAQEAIDALYEATDEVMARGLVTKVHLKEGDVLIIPNKEFLHLRVSCSSALFNGKDRILIRSYFKFDADLVTWEQNCNAFNEQQQDDKMM